MERIIEFALNHYVYVLALAVVTYLLVQELSDALFNRFGAISPLLAVTKMNDEKVLIIDVREPDEFIKGHIEGAVSKPLSSLTEQLPTLDKYKKATILIACQNGTRSASAGKILTKAGFEQILVITGGMQAWQDEYKLPIKVVNKYKK
ncbi:rhodanese-like domain-containing protein [Crenothrix sp.]|uniref:rhodanese-like domain-containing protein n=1 Tax=Crenothrix sp. TaxID=3100433 RepID=UPI00374DBD67